MTQRRLSPLRIAIEIAFIIFLFYSNLLMGEFTRSSGLEKSWVAAFSDIVTVKTFSIAVVSAVVGFLGFEKLRKEV